MKLCDLLDVNKCPDVLFPIVEGDTSMTAHCNFLGNFELFGIPPAPRGVPQIGVVFDIDANGVLCVSTEIKMTDKDMTTFSQNMGRLNNGWESGCLQMRRVTWLMTTRRRRVSWR